MKILTLTVAILSLLIVGEVAAQQPKRSTGTTPGVSKIVYEPDAELLKSLREKVRVAESEQDWAELDRQTARANPSKTRTAYAARFALETDSENLIERVVVYDAAAEKFYEIRGTEDFTWRSFSDFTWISDDVLQFDQWVNPNNGGRYRVNLKTGKIVAAGYVRSN